MTSIDFIDNNDIIIFCASIFLLVVLSLGMLLLHKKTKEWAKKKLNEIYKKMIFNGIIRIMTLSYIKYSIIISAQI
jgi:hypothetical protein